MSINAVRAGMDGAMIATAIGWLGGALPHLAWVVPTLYYAVLLSKEWPPACALCTRVRDWIKGFRAGAAAAKAVQAKPIEPVAPLQPIVIMPPEPTKDKVP